MALKEGINWLEGDDGSERLCCFHQVDIINEFAGTPDAVNEFDLRFNRVERRKISRIALAKTDRRKSK